MGMKKHEMSRWDHMARDHMAGRSPSMRHSALVSALCACLFGLEGRWLVILHHREGGGGEGGGGEGGGGEGGRCDILVDYGQLDWPDADLLCRFVAAGVQVNLESPTIR